MIQDLPQLSTIRIQCNQDLGTATLFFPGDAMDYVYVFTAKHCLCGKKFDRTYTNQGIVLEQLFNAQQRTYHCYQLTETDVVVTSPSDDEDLALLIIPKQQILKLIGTGHSTKVINTAPDISHYLVRGYANFNDQQEDRSFSLRYQEDQRDSPNIFLLKSDEDLNTFFNPAMTNVEGISGGGVWAKVNGATYLVGIIHKYEDGNVFTATKVLAYNRLIDQARFAPITISRPETNQEVIKTFEEMRRNQETISNLTTSTIGTLTIPRDTLPVEKMLINSGMAVIYGKPGVGKSVLAKTIVNNLKEANATTVLSFTAEHLYSDNLREALAKAGYRAELADIIASPLALGTILIWIESFEKIIESKHSGAVKELLSFVRTRPHVQMLVTIRDYTLQTFRINYNNELPSKEIYYQLQQFTDQEMQLVSTSLPELAPLLAKPPIYELLRTPYYLDKAVRILPELLKVDTLDELGFKALMWEHIVEKGETERGQVFSTITLKRAREMSLFTTTNAPSAIVNQLVSDNVLRRETGESGNRYSPSHDILEDWALIREIKRIKAEADSPKAFLKGLEVVPSFTRAFRLWMDEYYKTEPMRSAHFVESILNENDISFEWKEILLVATLRSDHAGILLDNRKKAMLANKGALLHYLMKLCQTSCQTVDPRFSDLSRFAPVGSGWDYLISFIRQSVEAGEDLTNLEGPYLWLIHSWGNQLPDFDVRELPPAAADAAFLLVAVIEKTQHSAFSYRNERDSFQRSILSNLPLLFKLTGAAKELVKDLLEAVEDPSVPHPRWTNVGFLQNVKKHSISGVMSDQLCKYFPELIVKFALEEWIEEPEKPDPDSIGYPMRREQEQINYFGLGRHIEFDLGFPSGYQTFFYWMFLHHPQKALDFVIPFLNRAFEINYQANQHPDSDLKKIKVVFGKRATREYYACYEYWSTYRGANARNKVVTSLLMALEKSLLDIADQGSASYGQLRGYFDRLIKEGNNVAFIGVIASLIQAHPELLDDTTSCLFGIREFYVWESYRAAAELTIRDHYIDDPFMLAERKREDKRPHRHNYTGLVGFVRYYLFYVRTFNEKLFKRLDQLWKLAPVKDVLWRKQLFDMDVRKYQFEPVKEKGREDLVQITPGYDKKVQKMMAKPDPFDIKGAQDMMWADKVFKFQDVDNKTYENWKAAYERFVAPNADTSLSSPGLLAAIGLREFAQQLSKQELSWCENIIFQYAERMLNPGRGAAFSLRTDDNQALFGLTMILRSDDDAQVLKKAREYIVRLIIGRSDENARIHIESGLTVYLQKTDPKFVLDCWYGVLTYIEFQKVEAERQRPPWEGSMEQDHVMKDDWKDKLIASVVDGTIAPLEHIAIDIKSYYSYLYCDALRLIPWNTNLPSQHQFINDLLHQLVTVLRDRWNRSKIETYQLKISITFYYARYLMDQPLKARETLFRALLDLTIPEEGIDMPDQLEEFLRGLVREHILAVNGGFSISAFWETWEMLKLWMIETHSLGLMPLFLMSIDWSENSDNWHVLDGKNLYYGDFISKYGHINVNESLKFLSGISFKKFMPDSISWIAVMFSSNDPFYVQLPIAEKFIHKAFYGYTAQIKGDRMLLKDFIFILDYLIIIHSSTKAYMIKEDLITYKNV